MPNHLLTGMVVQEEAIEKKVSMDRGGLSNPKPSHCVKENFSGQFFSDLERRRRRKVFYGTKSRPELQNSVERWTEESFFGPRASSFWKPRPWEEGEQVTPPPFFLVERKMGKAENGFEFFCPQENDKGRNASETGVRTDRRTSSFWGENQGWGRGLYIKV